MPEFQILVDTREKKPWQFDVYERAKLDAGDYTLKGFEKRLRIERKGCIQEFVNNVSKRDWPRFEDALRKLLRYKHRVVICEFEMRDIFAEKWRGRMTTEAILSKLSYITLEMQIPVVFAGKKGRTTALSFLLKYYSRHRR